MPERPDNGSSQPRGALSSALRDALQFDRRAISIQAGLLAAIPVAAVLAIGTIAWSAVAGVTMGAGAMLVGVAWRVGGGRPPIAVLAIDASLMSISTFVGCVTGSVPWLHFVVLCVWSLAGGLLVALGNRGGAVGTQSIIAFVVFGRFSQPAGPALGLASLVLIGGFAQVLFQSVARWPPPLQVAAPRDRRGLPGAVAPGRRHRGELVASGRHRARRGAGNAVVTHAVRGPGRADPA